MPIYNFNILSSILEMVFKDRNGQPPSLQPPKSLKSCTEVLKLKYETEIYCDEMMDGSMQTKDSW